MISKLIDPASNSIVISTGNILNIDKKPGRKSTEELVNGLKLTFKDAESQANSLGKLHRNVNELKNKLTEHERPNLSIGAKIFLNNNSTENLNQAVTSLLSILEVSTIDNVVLAYHPKPSPIVEGGDTSYGVLKWSSKNEKSTEELKNLWAQLERFSMEKKICQLGASDLDTDTLAELHRSSKVHPSIAQINLSSCCVVPPPLQEFCTKNDIQLLTHSDPEIILNDDTWKEFNLGDLSLDWVVRYQVHVRCRGVLTAKGYIVGASKHLK